MAVLLLEDFETPGYENSWSETIGAGNSIDDAYNGITPPEGSYSLQSVLAGTNAASYTDYNLGSSKTTCFATSFLYVDSGSSTADTGQETILSMRGAVDNVRVQLRYTATRGWHLFFKYYNSGQQALPGMQGDVNDNLQISTDTFYRLGIFYSSDTNEITGILWDSVGAIIDQATFTLTNARTDSQVIRIGCVDARTGATELLFDYVQADDAVWPVLPGGGESIELSGEVPGLGQPTASLISASNISGSIEGLGQPTGLLEISANLTGSVQGLGQPSGFIDISVNLSGSIDGLGQATTLIEVQNTLSGEVIGVGQATGILSVDDGITLSGEVVGLGQAAGSLEVVTDIELSGSVEGLGQATGILTIDGGIKGPITITMNLSKSNISINLSKPEISINLKKSNITMELIT